MPFYEYECQACKYYAEVMQKISDTPLTKCPSCGKRALKKLVSVPVFRLKGSGWYETDFKSDKEARRNLHGAEKEEAKAESKTESKTETAEAKPAAAGATDKAAKPAEGKASTAAAGPATSRERATPARGSAARRPVRASHKGRARKRRR